MDTIEHNDLLDYKRGIPNDSPVASIVAAATGTAVYDLSNARSARVRKLHIKNNNAADANVSLGTGLAGAYAAATIAWLVLAGKEIILQAEEIEAPEFMASITAASSVAAAAPADVQVQIQVEEYLSVNG